MDATVTISRNRPLPGVGTRSFECALPREAWPESHSNLGWDAERAVALARASDRASAHLAALGDKRFIFGPSGHSFVMYRRFGRALIAMGDPVGEPKEAGDLVHRFAAQARGRGQWPVFYQVRDALLEDYRAAGLHAVRIGEESAQCQRYRCRLVAIRAGTQLTPQADAPDGGFQPDGSVAISGRFNPVPCPRFAGVRDLAAVHRQNDAAHLGGETRHSPGRGP